MPDPCRTHSPLPPPKLSARRHRPSPGKEEEEGKHRASPHAETQGHRLSPRDSHLHNPALDCSSRRLPEGMNKEHK